MGDNPIIRFRWKLFIITLVLINVTCFVVAQNPHNCEETGNYTLNSTYSANLDAALASLSSNTTDNGFRSASVGQGQDRANALALCRADALPNRCRSCVETAATELVPLCPNNKQAIRWYEHCMLHYSNEGMGGDQSDITGVQLMTNGDVTNPAQFQGDRTELLGALRARAVNGSSSLKVGAGSRDTSDSETIYALVQCIPSMTPPECDDCLTRAVLPFRTEPGGRALLPSCNIRYEVYPFYNGTRLRELNVPVMQMPNSAPAPGTSDDGTGSRKGDSAAKIVVIIVVPIAVCLILAACTALFWRRRRKNRWQERQEIPEATEEMGTVESLQCDFRRISAATGDFATVNKMGQGGFGAVYWGKLENGQEIAVKRLSTDSGQGDMEFKNEVLLVAKLQHRNLVRLLGFSLEGEERLLIYEFVQNASLDQFIFDPIKGSQLDWQRRHKIIGGIARGLLYLHDGSRLRIIHRDLKASNILLDGEMNPKIADFGLARLFGQDEIQGNTRRVAGTYGYMSPEYARYGLFSVKSDVFSFGVLVLEIISGQKNLNNNRANAEDLLSYAWRNWHEGTAENVIDPVLRAGKGSVRDMFRCMHIGLLCVQDIASERPTMNSIVLMLSSSTITLPVPSQPVFLMSSRFGPAIPEHDYGDDTNSSKALKIKVDMSEGSSQNEMSVTELHPR